jgi:UDP-N-acetylmuramoylalanine--D-glutamate ligase
MKIAVVGYATDGAVSAAYFARHGHEVTVCDQNELLEVPGEYTSQLGGSYLRDMAQFDLIVRSSGIAPSIILADNPGVEAKITTSVNEFLRVCPTQNTIGITGTKGKGTTSTLTTRMLEAAGKKVWLGGNIGNSPLEFIDEIQPEDWVVLELSSFQLADITRSPHIAACLMVVPEHLDWHGDIADYTGAKAHLFAQQTGEDVAIYFASGSMSREIASHGSGQKIPYFTTPGAVVDRSNTIVIDGEKIGKIWETKLLGKHNWQNICAATTIAWQALRPSTPGEVDSVKNTIRDAIAGFSGLPHRIEFVREVNSKRYYNDSFATGLHATMAALDAVPGKKVAILGGYDRMLPLEYFGDFAQSRKDEFRTLLLIGASGPRLAEVLTKAGFTNFVLDTESKTMPQIVAAA